MSKNTRKVVGFNNMLVGKQAAAHVGLPVWTFMRWFKCRKMAKRRLPYYKVGNRYFFRKEDLDTWVEQHRVI